VPVTEAMNMGQHWIAPFSAALSGLVTAALGLAFALAALAAFAALAFALKSPQHLRHIWSHLVDSLQRYRLISIIFYIYIN